jgi:hypothetical protein
MEFKMNKNNGLGFSGVWKAYGYDRFNKLKWIEIIDNMVLDEGCNHALGAIFKGDTQYSTWYVLLFESNSTPVAGWVYANIGTNFTEFEDYDELTRPEWVSGTVSSKQVHNSASVAVFTASTGVSTTIYGAALVNVSTKGDNASPAGIEWCATRFSTARPLEETEVIRIVYIINSQDV